MLFDSLDLGFGRKPCDGDRILLEFGEMVLQRANDTRRNSPDNTARRHIMRNEGPAADDKVAANRPAGNDDGFWADEDIAANGNRSKNINVRIFAAHPPRATVMCNKSGPRRDR